MIALNFGKSLLLIVVLSVLSLGLIQTGAAYTLGSTSGIWTAVTGGPNVVYAGVGTSSITWGTPATSNGPSGSTFSGVGATTITITNGVSNVFNIGQITHQNYAINSGTGATGATLRVALTFTDPALPITYLNYNLWIDETPNEDSCTQCNRRTPHYLPCYGSSTSPKPCTGFSGPCPDGFGWSNTQSSQTFQIGNDFYTLVIDGFMDCSTGTTPISTFTTQEGCNNIACLYGHLLKATTAIQVVKKTNGQIYASAPGPTIPVGCPVSWQYVVTNVGENSLSSVTLTDNKVTVPSGHTGDTNSNGLLDKTETWIYTASGTAISGQYTNTASVSGSDSAGHPATDTDISYYYGCTPTLTNTLTSATACVGSSVTFAAAISSSGCSPTIQSYQWQKYSGSSWVNLAEGDGTKYSGTTTAANLIINSLVAVDAGRYRAVLTYYSGCTQITPEATLTVRPLISPIVTPPTTLCDGATATFSATPNVPATYSYQWQVNSGSGWTNVATGTGGTTPQYSFTATYADNGKQYRVKIGYLTTPSCPVDSTGYTLAVKPPISPIVTPPTTLCDGATATFSATPNDPATYSYQWQVNSGSGWTNVATGTGGTTPQYSFTATYADNGKQYRVKIGYLTAPSCPVDSTGYTLAVRQTINLDCPPDVSLCNGGTASFTVTPTPADSGLYQYQWDLSIDSGSTWTPITEATSSTYSFAAVLADNGKQYRVRVKYNTIPYCNEVTSCAAKLMVQSGTTVAVGGPMTICVMDGPIPLTGTATNAQSALWSIVSGGAYGGVGSTSYNPITGTATTIFTPTYPSPSTSFSEAVVVQLTATPKSPCGAVSPATQTITLVQKPVINIVVIQPAP
jgi:hypothetical protein